MPNPSRIIILFCIIHLCLTDHSAAFLEHSSPNTTQPQPTSSPDTLWSTDCPTNCTCNKLIQQLSDISNSRQSKQQTKLVNCSDMAFQSAPRKVPQEAEVLDFSNNKFEVLRKLPFVPKAIDIDLSENSITTIVGSYVFAQYKNLHRLSINHNKLDVLGPGTFTGLTHLHFLDLSKNHIKNISDHALAGLIHLTKLDLSNNMITELQHEWFEDCFELRELDLSDNKLTQINSKDLYALDKLQLLNLSGNRIREIDNYAFKQQQDLVLLDISNNKLKHVPTKALQMSASLKKLIVNNNPISKLYPGDMSNMNIHYLSINFMQQLVYIEENAFKNLPSLSTIECHDNPSLIYIDGEAFDNVPDLKTLYLHNNRLTVLSKEILLNLHNLAEVHLYHNPLRCDCNALWIKELTDDVKNKNFSKPYFNSSHNIRCDFPLNYTGISIEDVSKDKFSRVCAPSALSIFKENYTLDLGQELRIECHAYGIPKPILSWILPNGTEISKNVHSEKIEIIDKCILVVRHLTPQDSGTYACKSNNGIGQDISSTQVLVTNKPVRLQAYSVSNNYITITWNGTQHNSMISEYQLYYMEIKGGKIDKTAFKQRPRYQVIPLGPQYKRYTVSNLTPSTLYEFCIVYMYETESYKVDCKLIRTANTAQLQSAIHKVVSEKIVAGICTAVGLVLFVGCMVTLVKKLRFQKDYEVPYEGEESETINIPLDNMYQPLTTPLCSSKTSLLSVTTQKPGLDEY